MAIKFTTTAKGATHVKCLVYGESGVGKTTLAKTAPKPIIISSEHRLLSLKDENIPVILVKNHEDLKEAYDFITTSPKAASFETVVLDSVSDIAEAVLAYFKKNPKDGNTHPQAAYGSMADELLPLIKKFRDLEGRHVYFIAKAKRMKDDYTGITSWMASMPGQQLGPGLPYLFDFVLPMRIGETEKGTRYRYLQTQEDIQYLAKECSGNLRPIEKPHLGELFEKALGTSPKSENIEPKKTEEKKTEKPKKETEKIEDKGAESEQDEPESEEFEQDEEFEKFEAAE